MRGERIFVILGVFTKTGIRLSALMAAVAVPSFMGIGSPSFAADSIVSGVPRVVDGDALAFGKERIRLFGIDAPESKQTCRRPGGSYQCGSESKMALEALIGGRSVSCAVRERDRYGRAIAVCRQGGQDLNRLMVRTGWALAYRAYGTDYGPDEDAARADRVGVWAGPFEYPWDWRRERRGR